MKGSSEIGGRSSTASESTHAWESYGAPPFEISKVESNSRGDANTHAATRADAAAAQAAAVSVSASATANESRMTAASLLWGRGPMTVTIASMGSSSLSSASHDRKTNPNSPASNAAAALLVGMSMRKEREREKQSPPPAVVSNAAIISATAMTTKALDVETKWRAIRQKISKQTEAASEQPSRPENQEGNLELPKGVTRRPSGAWQAQIYFAGKTRYIGVWEKPHQAAIAYNLAKEALKELKAQQKNSSSNRKRQRYILAKEALKEHKAQQKNSNISGSGDNGGGLLGSHHRKRQRKAAADNTQEGCSNAPINSSSSSSKEFTMATPQREPISHLPPSITWPSSAESSSTASSAGFRSPPPQYTRGPFKKRMGTDHSPKAAASDGSFEFEEPRSQPLSQQQQQQQPQQLSQDSEAMSSILPRGHPYSAFSQQPLSQQHSNTPANLAHPALQLLSLRPPPRTFHWMHAQPPPQPSMYHLQQQQQHYHHQGLHPFPYSQPMPPPKEEYNGMQFTKPQGSTKQHSPAPMAKDCGRKTAKNGMNRKKSKPTKKVDNGPPTAKETERDAQNQKWKSIRTEVLAIFTAAKNRKLEGKSNGEDDNSSKAKRTFDKDVLRGITVRPSGKYQAQLYFGGRSRYIGVFNSEYDAASAYEMIRSRLKNEPKKEGPTLQPSTLQPSSSSSSTSSSSLSLSSLPSHTGIQNCKGGNTIDTTGSTTAMMRSITPSPTPSPKIRGKGHGVANKIVT